MSSSEPAIKPDSAIHTYLRAFLFIMPALLVWAFATVYLVPKLTMLWDSLGIMPPRVQAIRNFTIGLVSNFKVGFFTICVILVLLEKYQPAWPRFRRPAADAVAYLLNAAVMIAVTLVAVLALGASATQIKRDTEPATVPAAAVTPSPTATSNTSPP